MMTSVPLDTLVELHRMGFKLISLAKDSITPTLSSTNEVYNDPNYWTLQKLEAERYRFSNIATTYGKTHLKDKGGRELYLCELDVDSNEVFTRLGIVRVQGKEYFFINEMRRITYVVKTKKSYGYRFYWLSHKQHPPIRAQQCKPGYEFEIKTDNTSGHGTLPPSRHRDDVSFHYQAIGQNKISIQDKLYDGLLKVLADCLKPRKQNHPKHNEDIRRDRKCISLSDPDINTICDLIRPYYKIGIRHAICYSLSGVLHKSTVCLDCATNLLQLLTKDDKEADNRFKNLTSTYKKNRREVSGYNAFYATLQCATGDSSIAKNILYTINKLLTNKSGNDDVFSHSPLERLMEQFIFKTVRDTEDVYYYDETRGVYQSLGETIIKEQLEILNPAIRTNEVMEILNKIKRRTYVELCQFHKEPLLLNLRNGILNIMTGGFISHTADHLSLVQVPVFYNPKAKCPNILRFLGQVLRPKDVFTVLQLSGYFLYRETKYEKAVMCCGEGDNGKGTLLKLFERFLGDQNVSHASIQELNNDRFAVADLHDKLANVCADLKAERLISTGTFKMLVSGDTIRAQKKHAQPFSFKNYAKLIFSANEIPESNDQTYAYFKRWIILLFDRIFQGEDKDTNLIEKLTTNEELSGLLNLAIIALKKLIKDNGFTHVDDVHTIQREYNQNTTVIEDFLNGQCRIDRTDRDNYTICRDLYQGYILHCKCSNRSPVSDNVFGGNLMSKGIKKERRMVNKTREYCYVGISIRSNGIRNDGIIA